MIVLDSTVLSLAFRREGKIAAAAEPAVRELRALMLERAALAIPGIVLQEVLSGVRDEAQFRRLRALLGAFPVLLADEETHLRAARVANACIRKGVGVSASDCLIAAHALGTGDALLTTDNDFEHMAPHCGLTLHRSRPGAAPG